MYRNVLFQTDSEELLQQSAATAITKRAHRYVPYEMYYCKISQMFEKTWKRRLYTHESVANVQWKSTGTANIMFSLILKKNVARGA